MALANAVYFRSGYRALMTGAPYFFLVSSLLIIGILVSPLRNSSLVLTLVHAGADIVGWMVAEPAAAVALLVGLTLLVLAGSWLYASLAFSRRFDAESHSAFRVDGTGEG